MASITNPDWRAIEIADKGNSDNSNSDMVKIEISVSSMMASIRRMMASTRRKRVHTTGGTRIQDHRGRMTTTQIITIRCT